MSKRDFMQVGTEVHVNSDDALARRGVIVGHFTPASGTATYYVVKLAPGDDGWLTDTGPFSSMMAPETHAANAVFVTYLVVHPDNAYRL